LISKSLKKYLKNYAESEISDLNNFPLKTTYSNSVLIPVYLENTSFLKRLDTNLPDSSGRIMVVAISNHPLGLSSMHIMNCCYFLVNLSGKNGN